MTFSLCFYCRALTTLGKIPRSYTLSYEEARFESHDAMLYSHYRAWVRCDYRLANKQWNNPAGIHFLQSFGVVCAFGERHFSAIWNIGPLWRWNGPKTLKDPFSISSCERLHTFSTFCYEIRTSQLGTAFVAVWHSSCSLTLKSFIESGTVLSRGVTCSVYRVAWRCRHAIKSSSGFCSRYKLHDIRYVLQVLVLY
jgi:hypothetical protein